MAGKWDSLTHSIRPHSHDPANRVDDALATSRAGMRAVWVSLLVLGLTAAVQAAVVVRSGSVALLSDVIHNVADALTAVPVGVAFLLGRRAATRRFTYGFGRAEDVAGLVVVLVIAASAVAAGVASVRRLADPAEIDQLWLVAVAAVVGFAGNEGAAQVRIRTGRRIGSAALVADGLHARADALTSLAVLLSVGGAALGWRWADPAVGLLITAAIAALTWTAARQVLGRLMDAVDPALVDRAEAALRSVAEVMTVDGIRLRWIGHALHAEVDVTIADSLSLRRAHDIAHEAEHRLRHAVPRLATATVHAYPRSTHLSEAAQPEAPPQQHS
jgi:cation diffusion facilitator family transporter